MSEKASTPGVLERDPKEVEEKASGAKDGELSFWSRSCRQYWVMDTGTLLYTRRQANFFRGMSRTQK